MRSRIWAPILLLLVLLTTAACGGQAGQAPTPTRPPRTPRPTFTPATARNKGVTLPPTATRRPTMTAAPTEAPAPTVAPTATTAPTPTVESKAMLTVSNPTLNIRGGPGTAYAVIGQATQGQQFEVTGKNPEGDWWQFSYNGQPGWVIGTMVTVNEASTGVQVAADIPAAPTAAPQPTAAPARPTQPPAPPAPSMQFASQGLDPRPPMTNPWIAIYCRVWNQQHNGFVGSTVVITRGGQEVGRATFGGDVGTAGFPEKYKYNNGCKVEIRPVVDGEYTAQLVEGGHAVSDPIAFTVSGENREFIPVWQAR